MHIWWVLHGYVTQRRPELSRSINTSERDRKAGKCCPCEISKFVKIINAPIRLWALRKTEKSEEKCGSLFKDKASTTKLSVEWDVRIIPLMTHDVSNGTSANRAR
jgi:hypothetical protein